MDDDDQNSTVQNDTAASENVAIVVEQGCKSAVSDSVDEINDQHSEAHCQLTDKLKCLNVVVNNRPTQNPGKTNEGKRYSVKQVELTKVFIRVLLYSLVFSMYGIMTSVATTFFVEQADSMNKEIKFIQVPTELFLFSASVVRKLVSKLCGWIIAKRVEASHRAFYGAGRVFLGMLISLPCFCTASLSERKRLAKIVEHKKESAFLLLPQIFLMGTMDGLAVNGMEAFFQQEMPEGFGRLYGEILAEGATGLGKFLSVAFFHLVNKKRPGWFGVDLNHSHLDYYYNLMACVGGVCCVIYPFVAYLYSRNSAETASLVDPSVSSASNLQIPEKTRA